MKISVKKQILENSVKEKIHQIMRITSKNGKTEYRGRTYTKNGDLLEPGCISDAFEFREPEFYKLATTVTRDDDSQKFILYPLEDATNIHQLKSQNMGINLRVY